MTVSRNVTIAPDEAAKPVEDPEIAELLDLTSGIFHDVKSYVGSFRYGDFVRERVRIREALAKAPLFACAICSTPVYVVARPEKKFFFRHCTEEVPVPRKLGEA